MNENEFALTPADMLALLECSKELGARVTLGALLKSILAKASELTDSPDTSVILRHDDRDSLYVAAATGEKAEWVLTTFGKHSAKAIPIDTSIAGRVCTTGNSVVTNKVEGHFKGVDQETKKSTESMVCVPLQVGGHGIGAMQVLNKRSGDYTHHDRVLLEHFGFQAAIAIQNAQLVENLLAHSGLYTRLNAESELAVMRQELKEPARAELLTVMFADMRGFTQLCQSLPTPAEVQARLNEFVSMLCEEVISHDGMVNKFLGDGIMALFRHNNHPERAVKAGFQMVDRFAEMKQRWNDESSQQLDFLDIGMGIVTDQVTLGAIGSEKVRDFTAIGSAVNLAAAFEHDARNGKRILTNQLTYRSVKDFVDTDGPEEFKLKKADQTLGVNYKRYSLKKRADVPGRRVFISHSHRDRQFVETQVVKPLEELGIKTWYACDDIPRGEFWPAEIRKGLTQCDWMLVVVSKNSSNSDWVRLEVDLAIALGHMKGRILPICLDDTPSSQVNEYLVAIQALDARQTPQLASTIAEAVRVSPRGKADAR